VILPTSQVHRFQGLVTPESRSITVGSSGGRKLNRDAPTYNISNAEKLSPEAWSKLADDAEAEHAKLEEQRRGFAEEAKKSDAYFTPTPKGFREATLKSRELASLAVNARNAAYIASEKKLSNGEILKPGEVLVSATFNADGNLLGYGESGKTTVDGKEVKFSRSTSSKGKTQLGVVAVKGIIERGQVVPATQNLGEARVFNGSTAVNIAASNPSTESASSWNLGKGTPHGVVQGQPYFNYKPARDSAGFDSFVPEY
jgi:hypothetical protein